MDDTTPHGCPQCRRSFANADDLHAHCIERADHTYCTPCRRLFFHPLYLQKHLESAVHNGGGTDPSCSCNVCNHDFPRWRELARHCRQYSTDHFLCSKTCGKIFTSAPRLQQHMKESGHRPDGQLSNLFDGFDSIEGKCNICLLHFEARKDLEKHMSKKHKRCFECARGFDESNALNQHKHSIAHKPRVMKCALCLRMFKEPSSIALHIESGECTPGLNRHQVTQTVQALEVKPSILIDDSDDDSDSDNASQNGSISSVAEIFSSATAASKIRALSFGVVTAEVATEEAFNGTAYVCPRCEQTFKSLYSLNLHLSSAAHDDDKFKCPDCEQRFTLLSGLIQHLESESCGAASIKKVEKEANLLTAQFAKLLCGA